MRRTVLLGFGALAVSALAWTAIHQDEMQPRKYQDVEWFSMLHVRFHPQHSDDALSMIFDHFAPAGQAAGLNPPYTFEYSTGGEWDITLVFPMENGPSELEWEMSDEDGQWFAKLAEREGGPEQAEELFNTYLSYVDRHEMQIVRRRNLASMTASESDGDR